MENTKTIEKPIQITIKETKQAIVGSIVTAINESRLPACIIEPMVKEIYLDLVSACDTEYNAALKQYNDQLKEVGSTETDTSTNK